MRKISINTINSISKAISDLDAELSALLDYPKEELARIIADVGFSCTLCGRCCTKEFNDHVCLLSEYLVRAVEKYPSMIIPAPYFEVCDNNGCFYVSGYALKTKNNGDCVFLEDKSKKCRIYDDRFSICKIYPYMLHREADETGNVEWRQISGLDQHGEYGNLIPENLSLEYAEDTINYEKKFLLQEKDFYITLLGYFKENNLKPVRKIYDENMRIFKSGGKITIFAFNGKSFDKHIISKDDYITTNPSDF